MTPEMDLPPLGDTPARTSFLEVAVQRGFASDELFVQMPLPETKPQCSAPIHAIHKCAAPTRPTHATHYGLRSTTPHRRPENTIEQTKKDHHQ